VTRRLAVLACVLWLGGCGTDSSPTAPGGDATPSVVVTAVRWEARQRVGDAGERPLGRCGPSSDALCRSFNEEMGPALAANAAGAIAALWQRWEGDGYRLAASRRLPDGGWSAAVGVAADTGVTDHRLALDARGEALALWDQPPNGSRTSRGTSAGTWSAPESTGIPGRRPEVVLEPDGTAHLLFTRSREGLYAITRPPGSGWSAPVRVRSQGPELQPFIGEARLALEPGGGLVAVWLESFQGAGPWHEVWSSRATGDRWTAPARAARFEGETVPLSLQLAATASSTVAFYQLVERRTDFPDVWRVVEQHDGGPAWSSPAPLDTPAAPSDLGQAQYPVVAADASGTFTLAWAETSYTNGRDPRYRLLARRYAPATGAWEPPQVIEDTGGWLHDSYGPHVVASAAGDAILVWVQHGVPLTLWASAFVPGRGWTAPAALTRADRLTDVAVAMEGRGNGVVAWAEPEGDRATVFAVRLAADAVPAGR
jgi:hypothetical protein